MKIIESIKKFAYRTERWLREKTTSDGVSYIFTNNKSKNLVIVFSGIGSDYNYRRSFKASSWDQLYIKDSWAEGVSYYLYENGSNHPEKLTSSFIEQFLSTHQYAKIATFGSSKGGTSAIYFGLKHHVDEIYAGACQYLLGDYLGIYHEKSNSGYYKKVSGVGKTLGIDALNAVVKKQIESNVNSDTIIHLLYSKNEHTYEDHIIHLIKKLDECNIKHIDQVEDFPEHSMIGDYMKLLCSKFK